MAVNYRCAEEAGGCGILWTPTRSTRPVKDAEANTPWGWCPDCQRTGAADV